MAENETDNLPPLPPRIQKLLEDTATALRISLSNGRTPKKLRIRLDTYPDGDFVLQQTWQRPKAVKVQS
jgi:hypothetical protein